MVVNYCIDLLYSLSKMTTYITVKYIGDWVVIGIESDDKYHKQG